MNKNEYAEWLKNAAEFASDNLHDEKCGLGTFADYEEWLRQSAEQFGLQSGDPLAPIVFSKFTSLYWKERSQYNTVESFATHLYFCDLLNICREYGISKESWATTF